MAMSIQDFQDLFDDKFREFAKLSESVGGDVAEHAKLIEIAVQAQFDFLKVASQTQKPNDKEFETLFKSTLDALTAVRQFPDSHRRTTQFDHLRALTQGIDALCWVSITPTPGPFVKEMTESSKFYTNKVLVAYKEKDPNNVAWAKSWIEFLTELEKFVRKNHTTGLVWNPKGVPASSAGAAPAPVGGPALPPPPPPPAGFFDDVGKAKKDDSQNGGTRAALFASLNQGTAITSGLKKVAPDQMTHKNPELRASSTVKGDKVPEKQTTVKREAPKAPPKFELEGRKWVIENHIQNKSLVVENAEMSQVVFVHNCKDSLLTIKDKVNTICIDQCQNFAIVIESLLGPVEFINCRRVQVQINGQVPSISVDKVDNIEVYLSKDSLTTEIISSKSTGINISVPDATTGDYREYPIPEQFKSVWNGKGFNTASVENE